jgi:hypothetical protein
MSQYDHYDLEKHEMTIHTAKEAAEVPEPIIRSEGDVDEDE